MGINVGNKWQMFMSDGLYEPITAGITPTVNPPLKIGKVFDGIMAWDNTLILPCSILDDPITIAGETFRYRMYYSCDCLEFGVADPHCVWRKMALAVSHDGINWIRPSLGLFNCGPQCGNSSANNILDVCPMVVWRDDIDSPARRYKGLSYGAGSNENRVWYSADGLAGWTMGGASMFSAYADGANQIAYDTQTGKYVALMRSWWNQTHPTRSVARLEGPANAMQAWPQPPTFYCSGNGGMAIDASAPDANTILHHAMNDGGYYNPAYFAYPLADKAHLFMPSLLEQSEDYLDIYLAYARSLQGAMRTPENDAALAGMLIPRGTAGGGDQTIYAQPMVIQTGVAEESYYYTGYAGTHKTGVTSGTPAVFRAKGRLRGLMTLKSEGNVTVTGEAITLPTGLTGMRLNAKALGGSSIKVALCTLTGNEIAGFGLAQAVPFTGDSVDAALGWTGNPDMAGLAGQTVRVKYQIVASVANPVERAAFQFTSGASNAPEVQFAVGALTIGEDCGPDPYCIPLLIDHAPTTDITVRVNLTSGNANDIGGWTSGVVVFPAGSIEPRCLQIAHHPNNGTVGANAPLVFDIQASAEYGNGPNDSFTLNVIDDDSSVMNYPPCAYPPFLIAPVCGSGQITLYAASPSIVGSTLPDGVAEIGMAGGTPVLSVRNVTQAGVYSVQIGDGSGTQDVVVIVWGTSVAHCGSCPPPSVSYPVISPTAGQPFSLGPSTWANVDAANASGLPPWATFNPMTGALGGTAQAGIYSIVITATNACGSTSKTVAFGVDAPCAIPILQEKPTQHLQAGRPATIAMSASGDAPLIFTIDGPAGVSINQSGVVTAMFPLAGTYVATITAENDCGSASVDITFVVTAAECLEGFLAAGTAMASGGCTNLQYQSGNPVQGFTTSCAWMSVEVVEREEVSPGCWVHTLKVCGSNPTGAAVNCKVCPV